MRGLLGIAFGLLLLLAGGVPPADAGATDRTYVGGRFLLDLSGTPSLIESFETRHGMLAADVDLGPMQVTLFVIDNNAKPVIVLSPVEGVHLDDDGNAVGEVIGMHVEVRGWDPKQKKGRLGLDLQGDLEGKYDEAAQVDVKGALDLKNPFKVDEAFYIEADPIKSKKTQEVIGIHVEIQPTGKESSQLILLGDLTADDKDEEDDDGQ